MATSSIENLIKFKDESDKEKIVKQKVTITTDEKELFSISAGTHKLISLAQNKDSSDITFKFIKENFNRLDFGEDFNKSELFTMLSSKTFKINSKSESSPISLTENSKDQQLVFSISPTDEDGKKIKISINAISVSIEYEGKKYQSKFNAKNFAPEELESLSNNFSMSNTFFEKIVDSEDETVKTLEPKKIPSYLIGQYFAVAEKNDEFKINTKKIGNVDFVYYQMNGKKYCFLKDNKTNELYIFHNGTLTKINNKEIKLYKDGGKFFLFVSLPSAKYVSLPLPENEENGRYFLKNFVSDIAPISSPRSKSKTSYAGFASINKDERDVIDYNFSIKSKTIKFENKHSKDFNDKINPADSIFGVHAKSEEKDAPDDLLDDDDGTHKDEKLADTTDKGDKKEDGRDRIAEEKEPTDKDEVKRDDVAKDKSLDETIDSEEEREKLDHHKDVSPKKDDKDDKLKDPKDDKKTKSTKEVDKTEPTEKQKDETLETKESTKKTAENTKKKFDTKFLGETAMPMLGFAFLIIAALTGGVAFIGLAIASMAASVGFIYLDGKELNIYRALKEIKDNKYTKFREMDHECGKAKENYKEKYHEMQKFVQNSKDKDFAPNFFKYYDQYGISSESHNLAQKYELATNKSPSPEMLEKFTEIQMAQDEGEKTRLQNEFLSSLPESEKDAVEKEFNQSSFLDLDHAEVQREAYHDLEKITSETNPGIKTQLKTKFIEKFMPNIDLVLPVQFAKEFSDINETNKSARVVEIVEKYYPNLTEAEKTAKIADISMIADIVVDKSVTPQTKKAKIHDYIAKNKSELKQNMINQIMVDCFGEKDENHENVKQFNDNLIALSSSASRYSDKKESVSSLIRKEDPTFLFNLFYYEKDDIRKRYIIDQYSDAIAQKFIYNKTDSQIAFDKFIQLLPENMRDYATARFKFSCAKIDIKTGRLHKDIYKAVKSIEEIDNIENISRAIFESKKLDDKKTFNELVTDLPEAYYDAMILSDCCLDSKTGALFRHSLKSNLIVSTRKIGENVVDITLSDILQSTVNSKNVHDAFLDYQSEIKSSGILVELSQASISKKNSETLADTNLEAEVSADFISSEKDQKSKNSTFSQTIDEHIKTIIVKRLVELARQEVLEKDFDKAVFDERSLKEKLSKLSLSQLKNKIETEYPDKSVFYGEDKSLPKLLSLLEKKLQLNKELDENLTFAKFDKHFSGKSSSVIKKGKNLVITDTSYFGKKKTSEVIAIIDEHGKLDIKNKDLEAMIKNYSSIHTDTNLYEYMESLSPSEKACLIKLLHLQMLLTKAYIENPRLNIDAKERADVIDLIVSRKVSGSLNEEFIEELTRQNADILVNDKELKTECENAKNSHNDKDDKAFDDIALMTGKKYFKYEKDCRPIQEILDLLPRHIRINVFNRMRRKRELGYEKDSGVRLLLMTLKEEIEENKELKTLIESKLNGKKFTDLTDEKVLSEFLETTSKEKEERMKNANRAYSTSTEDLSSEMVSSEVKSQSKAMKKRKYASQSLESEEEISSVDVENKKKEQELKKLNQTQSKFYNIITKIKKYLGNENEINDYRNFSDILQKLLSGDESTLKLLGIEKEELSMVIEYMIENNIASKTFLQEYLKKYNSKKSSLEKSKQTASQKTISLNKTMKKEWEKIEKEINLKFKEKEEKIKEEKDKLYIEAVNKDKLNKKKDGNKVRKSARWFIKRKNKEKLEKDKESIAEIPKDKDKELVVDKETSSKKDSEKE